MFTPVAVLDENTLARGINQIRPLLQIQLLTDTKQARVKAGEFQISRRRYNRVKRLV